MATKLIHSCITVLLTPLLKEIFKSDPSQTSPMLTFFWSAMIYKFQNWVARLQLPNQQSSQNLIDFPSPMFHFTPNWASLQVQRTPFQKGKAPINGQQKMFGLLLYLWSTIFFQITLSFKWYLLIQEANKQRFILPISGIPQAPCSFLRVRLCQLDSLTQILYLVFFLNENTPSFY